MTDLFFDMYDREEVAYGATPSAAVQAFLDQAAQPGPALDLGAGAGRDSLALAHAGYDVTAVDLSARGLERIMQRAEAEGVADRIRTRVADVREVDMPPAHYHAIVATTVLDHVPAADAVRVWTRMTEALAEPGFLSVEVHTTEDPGCPLPPGCHSNAPVSETADAVINYFPPNQLVQWAVAPEVKLRVLRYEERLEWDYTHGPEHLHGKALLLAVRSAFHPPWYGQPAAFPRR